MEKKINIAELLKDCPNGMELDCLMYENLYFESLNADYYGTINCYTLIDGVKTSIDFTKYGTFNNHIGAKCVIFPKGKTTWEGFHRPFKDGDIVTTIVKKGYIFYSIYKNIKDKEIMTYIDYCPNGDRIYDFNGVLCFANEIVEQRLSTEEEKQKLFDAIKANDYRWNAETKTLEKLIEPKFKKGDKVRIKNGVSEAHIIEDVCDTFYTLVPIGQIDFAVQDKYELVPNKFDISTLKPFDKVLVRGNVGQKWIVDFFGFMDNDKGFPFVCVGHYVKQCIPYENNEHLLGTTNDCDNYYNTWE